MRTKQIWLIRHAESEANIGGKTYSPATIGLSNAGFKQAEDIALQFSRTPDLIITSSYIRTKHTAAPTIKRFLKTPNEEWPVYEFTYLSPSRCQNTTITDRLSMVEHYWRKADPGYCDGEGAESFNDFINRARLTLSMLRERKEDFIVIFTHGQFMCAMQWLLGQSVGNEKIYDMLAFRKFIDTLALKNGQKMKLIV